VTKRKHFSPRHGVLTVGQPPNPLKTLLFASKGGDQLLTAENVQKKLKKS
jgi:hypothetical protein